MRETYGREVYYDLPDPKLKQATQWLISNPNRVNLGRIGFRYKNVTIKASAIKNPRQELDLWSGVITSNFVVDGQAVGVVTQGDFDSDAVAFEIESELLENNLLQVEFDFPYPPIHTTAYKYEVSPLIECYRNCSEHNVRCSLAFMTFPITIQRGSLTMMATRPRRIFSTRCRILNIS